MVPYFHWGEELVVIHMAKAWKRNGAVMKTMAISLLGEVWESFRSKLSEQPVSNGLYRLYERLHITMVILLFRRSAMPESVENLNNELLNCFEP